MATTTAAAEEVARAYFGAIERGDEGAQAQWYADDAVIEIPGLLDPGGKPDITALFVELRAAMPDFAFAVRDVVAEGDRASVLWRITGTFAGPGEMQGFKPNGAQVALTGVDVVTVRDGLLVHNEAHTNYVVLLRQLGVLPPAGSPLEQRMARATNLRTRLTTSSREPEEIAEGVWRLSAPAVGFLGDFAVYFVRDGDGVLTFDAGIRTMAPLIAGAAARLGGLTRVVLGHGHTDHRGGAPALGVPVLCHPDEVVDAEGSGGWRYWDPSLSFLPQPVRALHKTLHHRVWDGGPVKVDGTLSEGDDVAGFRVVHLPGHAPGLIALWRESDRLALVSDAFYLTDMWGRPSPAHVPTAGYNLDTEQARASLRKLAALDPAAAWPGHLAGLTEDVRGQLEQAAEAPA